MHPSLVAPPVEDRYWCFLLRGATKPYRLCRGCRRGQRPEVLDHAATSSRRFRLACHVPKALPFAPVLSLLKNADKGAEG
jgi:hypothetical protein